jgi:hypothetical protein
MTHHVRRTALSLATASALVVAVAVPASADTNVQDGLVNLAVGRITITDINVNVAAQVAAAICGVRVGPVLVLANLVDAGNPDVTVCKVANFPVKILQN